MSRAIRCPWCWGLKVEVYEVGRSVGRIVWGEGPCSVCKGDGSVSEDAADMVDGRYLLAAQADPP